MDKDAGVESISKQPYVGAGERNFHVFYYLFADDAVRAKYNLTVPKDFTYVGRTVVLTHAPRWLPSCLYIGHACEAIVIETALSRILSVYGGDLRSFGSWQCAQRRAVGRQPVHVPRPA